MPFFFSPLLSTFVWRSHVLLASFSFLLPVFFSSLSLLLCSAFLFLKASAETDEDDRCWSFCAQLMVVASRDIENDGHAGFGLCSFSLLLLMLSLEMTKMMAMKACCAGGVVALASVFLAFDNVVLMAFSTCLSHFFLFFFSRFSLFSPFFFCPLARSLEGLIYSLTYLYLGKIQCINSMMQIPADLQ